MVKCVMIPQLDTGLSSFHETMTVILERFTAITCPFASGATQEFKEGEEEEEEEGEEEKEEEEEKKKRGVEVRQKI